MTTKKSTIRKFYAAYHTYGKNIVNDVAYIVRFDSRAARDSYVNDEPWDGSNFHREDITRKQAQAIFPDAFRLTDNRDFGYCIDMRDWRSDKPGEEFFAPYC